MLVILALLFSLLIPSYAASSSTTSQPASYSSEYNSGTRDVVCTTLEGTSADEYYENYDYDYLSTLSASALFTQLQTLMRTTHTKISSYDDCHYKADKTDCENGDGRVSLIYTSYSATMSQWNGWNREHVWPQSLGGDNTSGGGADLHHVRPSDAGVNSSRGNKKYGESGSGASEKYGSNPAVGVLGGTYNSTYFEPLDNVKGDVARICLYVYVRWNSAWGADSITKVFQSVDVLLEWCEMDPVDTWEMGRNEVVQSIQGNRNVFIDYPEYAWLIFGREVPADMTTPSSGAEDNGSSGGSTGGSSGGTVTCQHTNTSISTVAATCTKAGSITVTCSDCGEKVSTTSIAAKGHSYVDGTCSACGLTQGGISGSDYSGTYYIATKRSSGNYWYMSNSLGTASTKRYQAIDTKLTNLPDSISAEDVNDAYLFTLESNNDGTYKIYANGVSGDLKYLGWSSGNSGDLVSSSSAKNVTVDYNSSSGTFSIHFKGDVERYLSLNSTSGNNYFAWYKSGQSSSLVLIPVASAQCSHTNSTTKDTATCTEAGVMTVTCNSCGETLSSVASPAKGHTHGAPATCDSAQICTVCKVVIVAAFGHNYVDGSCTVCSANLPTVTFSVNGVIVGCEYGTTVTLPDEPKLPAVNYSKDYTFVGWAINTQDNVTVMPEVYNGGATVTVDKNTTYYAVYSYSDGGASASESWVKKELSQIKPDDVVVVTMSNGREVYALSNDKGTSAAPTAVVVSVNNNALVGDVADNIKWNISNNNGNITFYVNGNSGKWLYCTSSNNGVRVGTNTNKVFTIDSTSGYLQHSGTTRYIGVYTTNPDWRCYTTVNSNITGQTLAFYVLESASSSSYTTTLECESYFTGASLNVGADLSLRYHAILGDNAEAYTVRFTMNGKVVTVSGEKDPLTGKHVFSFCGIAPQCMGDIVKAELLYNGEVVHSIEEYSVRHYVIGAIEKHSGDSELMRLLSDMLYYGAAAQIYRGYKMDSLVTEGVVGILDATDSVPSGEIYKNVTNVDTTNVRFTAAGVHFDYVNRIYVKIDTAYIGNVKIVVDGKELDVTPLPEGGYIAYSDGISALHFRDVVEFTLLYNGSVAQTLTYTVNDYARAMDNDATASESMKELALALYRYGEAARAYAIR